MKVVFLALMLLSFSVSAEEYKWKVVRVLDGDTFEVETLFYPSELGKIKVRVAGIDTPEKNPRAKCIEENALAQTAHKFAVTKLTKKTVTIKNVQQDKYGGRIVADVYIGTESFGDSMIRAGLARAYDGRTKKSWCSK